MIRDIVSRRIVTNLPSRRRPRATIEMLSCGHEVKTYHFDSKSNKRNCSACDNISRGGVTKIGKTYWKWNKKANKPYIWRISK